MESGENGNMDNKELAEQAKLEANKHFKEKKYALALEGYTRAIELNPNNAIYYSNRAFAHIRLENYGAAIEDATKSTEIDAKYVKGYYRRGDANFALGRFKEALKDLKKAAVYARGDPDLRKKLAECEKACRRQKFEECISMEEENAPPVSESVDIISMAVDESYRGPKMDEDENGCIVTLDFVKAMMEEFRDQRVIHRKYAFALVLQCQKILKLLPNVVNVTVPDDKECTVCGDVHGQYYDLLNIFELNGLPSEDNPYLFNGDFVDRGSFSVEVILTLMAFKCLFPNHMHLTRGNHESKAMNKIYGFEGEVKHKYNGVLADVFRETFCWLPLAYVLNKKVLILHGGLFSKDGVRLEHIQNINRNCEPPDEGLMCETLWSDPHPIEGRRPSQRGVGVAFGPDVTKAFLENNNLELLIRSHEVKDEGYEVAHNGQLITVFSAPNYCLSEEMQLLTDQGFVFLDEFIEAYDGGKGGIKVAGFDPENETLVYETPTNFILNDVTTRSMLDFTPSGTGSKGSSWWDVSDDFDDSENANHHLSMVVTPEHQMFVKTGEECGVGSKTYAVGDKRRREDLSYEKMRADALTSTDDRSTLRMLSLAANGFGGRSNALIFMEELALKTEEEITAFLEIYGYWLGDGSLEFACASPKNEVVQDAVVFTAVEDVGFEFLQKRLELLGMVERDDYCFQKSSESSVPNSLGVHKPSWTRLFHEQYELKHNNEPNACEQESSDADVRHARWFWDGVWLLTAEQMQAVLRGLVFVDAARNGTKALPNTICTSSARFRDELVRAGLHAGYSASFCSMHKDGESVDLQEHWRVTFTTELGKAAPVMRRSDVRSVGYTGRTWCVTMPCGLIWVRRALRGDNGVVIKASRPTVSGNCDSLGNKGAFVKLKGSDMVPHFTQFSYVPHPDVKPMAYANSFLFGLA